MTCKDCIHYEVCKEQYYNDIAGLEGCANWKQYSELIPKCAFFKDKSKFVELPCKVGDKIYQTNGERLFKDVIVSIEIFDDKTYFQGKWMDFDESAINHSIFLSIEEAEKALKEIENNDRT